ncbi:MAG: hypothetical protein HYZ14_06145 [Bacteroidetes bacterium]|nr:hypothetical protein [Bacteroidota bacterium]
MSKPVIIHEGLTYEYLVPGLFVLILGGAVCFFSSVPGCIILITGILLMLLSTGIEVDAEGEKMRKYKSILRLKFGTWESLKNTVTVELKYNANAVKISGLFVTQPVGLTSIFPNPGASAKTFDLYLADDTGEEKLVNQFLKIGLALKTLKALEQIPHLKIINHFEAMLKVQRKDRR